MEEKVVFATKQDTGQYLEFSVYCNRCIILGCLNGECMAPNTCACDVGWEGFHCDVCIPLPGCKYGSCNTTALECICNPGWSGAFCDIRKLQYTLQYNNDL